MKVRLERAILSLGALRFTETGMGSSIAEAAAAMAGEEHFEYALERLLNGL